MIAALVRVYPVKTTHAQLGALSRIAASGGTFRTYFGTLKRAGYVLEQGDLVELTEAGLEVGGGAPLAPQTTEEAIAMWRKAVRAGERRMLDALLEVHPASVTAEDLGERSDVEVSGGTFRTYLGTLRRNGLAEVTSEGIRAGATLFREDASRSPKSGARRSKRIA